MNEPFSINELYEILGKVCPTVNGDWDIDKEYPKLSIVKDSHRNSYVSKKAVPKNIDIYNTEYWQLLCNSVGTIENFSATVDEVTSVDEHNKADASVSIYNDGLHFNFAIPRGKNGQNGSDGRDGLPGKDGKDGLNGRDGRNGVDAVGGRTVFAFIHKDEKPEIPTGGLWDITTNEIFPPKGGWQNNSSNLEHPIWMSTCVFGNDGLPEKAGWSEPIQITGANGEAGTDGANLQFIFLLVNSEKEKPTTAPKEKPQDNYEAPYPWTNHPTGISETKKAEYMCFANKDITTKLWSDWQGPVLWSNYGINGMDGDGIKYAYIKSSSSIPPETPAGTGADGEFPKKPEGNVDTVWWTDEPVGVDKEYKWEFVTRSKYSSKTKTWSNWSKPTLWATFGEKGTPGISGRNVIVFTASKEKPNKPIGGKWDVDTNIITPPTDETGAVIWYNNDAFSNPTNLPVWISSGTFNENGELISEWGEPIRITGNDGQNGTDGGNTQYIYKLVVDETARPKQAPIESPRDDYKAPNGWTDHPSGVSENFRTEYMCVANKRSSEEGWGIWYGPFLWSNYGINGVDGDGVKYAFKITSSAINPGQPLGSGEDGEFPKKPDDITDDHWWTDDPIGVDTTFKWEWVTKSKYDGNTKRWSNWTKPSLWAKYGENGHDGINTRTMYAVTNSSSNSPYVNRLDINPGSDWSLIFPSRVSKDQYIWGIQAQITVNNELIDRWSPAYLITGINGTNGVNGHDGKDAVLPNYTITVYKTNPTKPDKPVSEDPNNPGVGWVDYPNIQGVQWWQCIGLVNGQNNTIINWGEVLQLNGNDGTSFKILGTKNDISELPEVAEVGDGYLVKGHLHVWNGSKWEDVGEIQGPQGVPGEPGKNYYTWIRYADDVSGNGISNNPIGKEYIGFAYNKPTPIESNTPSDYKWSSIKGTPGVPGEKGADGKQYYTWIKYSDYEDGYNISGNPSIDELPKPTSKYIGIAINKPTSVKSDNPRDYTWSRFLGYAGDFTEFRFAKSSNSSAPRLITTSRRPDGWETYYPTINTEAGETMWQTHAYIRADDTLKSNWSNPIRISGERGPKGNDGPAGVQGPTGIPGKTVEIRYCLGGDKVYDGTSTPSNIRRPNGWNIDVPTTSSSKPYIWFIQATINYRNNDDREGTISGVWSKPNRLSGKNGLNGANGTNGTNGRNGAKGQIPYPAGVYNLNEKYVTDDKKAPYVLDTQVGKYYILNTQMTWIGTEQQNRYPNQSSAWVAFENFEALYTSLLVTPNALIGSAVMNGDYMFSQQSTVHTETRYCLGTNNNYNATYKPGSNNIAGMRDPSSYGWKLEIPTPTTQYPVIWFIQTKITNYNKLEHDWTVPKKCQNINNPGGFEGFNPEDPFNINNDFIPTFAVNFRTGEVFTNQLYKKWITKKVKGIELIDLDNTCNYIINVEGSVSIPGVKLPTDIKYEGVEVNILYNVDYGASVIGPIHIMCDNDIYVFNGSSKNHAAGFIGVPYTELYKLVSFIHNGKLHWFVARGNGKLIGNE